MHRADHLAPRRLHGLWLALPLGLVLLLGGCRSERAVTAVQSQVEQVRDPLERLPPSGFTEEGRAPDQAAEAQQAPVLVPQPAIDPGLALFDIPFDFDRARLRFDARDMVEVNAMRLKELERDSWGLLLEGRCDEVGTAAYNLILGERRARAVQEYLLGLGIPSEAIDIVSYGRERPLCREHSVDCWAKNRTVRFVLRRP